MRNLIRRGGAVATAAGALLMVAPMAAQAASTLQTLQVGEETCISQKATKADVVTWATPLPGRFRVYFQNTLIFDAPSSFGINRTFNNGLGRYEVCGKNQNSNTGPTQIYLQLT